MKRMPPRKTVDNDSNEVQSVFATLNKVDVNDHTEQKNGLTYLSWAWAWAELLKRFPDSTYTIYENANGLFYHTDGKTAWVKTGVTVEGKEYIEYLPVMDYKNKSIALENITSFDVNKSIQRSLTKAVARHGLGLYIYAGEDLPEDAAPQKKEEDLSGILDRIQKGISFVTKNMDKEAKDKFVQDVIVKHIGDANYIACKDAGKLKALLNELLAMSKKAA